MHQLACCAQLDHDDRYGIDQVGWYFARIGVPVDGDLPAFLRLLGATRPRP